MRRVYGLLAVLVVSMVPAQGFADGMAYYKVGATTEVEATAQRAIMWLRNGQWEIHIQPHFYREAGSAAWVVPFSVLPQVQEGNADFFDHLEIITSPVFMEVCSEDSGGGGCAASSADGGKSNLESGEGYVKVWAQGTVGQLDYVILSAGDGDDLAQWLVDNEFVVPAEAQTVIGRLETEGTFFFVARLSENADPDLPISPVRFILPDIDPPVYPLRMTGLGTPEGKFLDLTLWVVSPAEQKWLPQSPHSFEEFTGNPEDKEAYDQALDSFFQGRPSNTFLLLFAGQLDDVAPASYRRCAYESWGDWDCVSLGDMDIDLPGSWAAEINEISGSGHDYVVYRLQARLDSAAMEDDLTLAQFNNLSFTVNNVYRHHIGDCPGRWSCSMVGGTGAYGILFALAVLAVFTLLRRRRSQ